MTHPPGWIRQFDGSHRYWDGSQWSDHVIPPGGQVPQGPGQAPVSDGRPAGFAPPTYGWSGPAPQTSGPPQGFNHQAPPGYGPPPAKAWFKRPGIIIAILAGLLVLGIVGFFLVRSLGLGGGSSSRDNPVPVGESVRVGDFEVSLGTTNKNADDIVAQSSYGDEPEAGKRFVMVPMEFTYVGDDSGTPWLDLDMGFVTDSGNTYGSTYGDCYLPDNALSDIGEMYEGAKASGDLCVQVPVDQIDGGVWSIAEQYGARAEKHFFAIE